MRKLVSALYILGMLFASPAVASDYAKQRIDVYFTAAIGTAQNQETYCPAPRSKTTARCVEDFGKLYAKAAEALGFDLLHQRAVDVKDDHAARYFRIALDRSFDEMQAMQKSVKELYYPLVTQAPAPSTTGQAKSNGTAPKIFKTKGKQ